MNLPYQPYTFQNTHQHGGNRRPYAVPLESNYNTTSIPGTNLFIGNIEKVLLTDQEERIFTNDKVGILCGCNHHIFTIEAGDEDRGLGGQCPFCVAELIPLVEQNLISVERAQSLSLFCTFCRSLCRQCSTIICLRHASAYLTPRGPLFLCPKCAKKYEEQRFVNKVLTFLMSPILENPKPSQEQIGGQS